MLPREPHPAQLLHYLPTYKVIVCMSCEYAVQPSAVASHLKDIHNIERSVLNRR